MIRVSTFGEAVVLFRIRAGLSQQELSGKIQVPRLELLNWEQGKHIPNEQQIKRISKKLLLSPREMNVLLLLASHSPVNAHKLSSSAPVIVDNYILIPDSLQQNRSLEVQVQIKDIQKTIEELEEIVRGILPKQKEQFLTLSQEVTNLKMALAQLKTYELPNQPEAYPVEESIPVIPANISSSILHKIVCEKLSMEEFKTLCFRLGSPYSFDDLEGAGREAKARELILKLMRRKDIYKLLVELPKLNPSVSWKDFL